ncbi:hypothetical protein SAMN04488542_11278 [Fontibacillus panacisegetis]|uniref:Uncharacterized protein n=1 Tax=Fontibacillus panacisegetis TaxID=670482 RepID=A0A1G7LV88_9BACL|nr:hypothetical protein SAMN04488542_11278 [Fontibacillus panacisegetis]
MENGKIPVPSSLFPVFISRHYTDYNKVVIEVARVYFYGTKGSE